MTFLHWTICLSNPLANIKVRYCFVSCKIHPNVKVHPIRLMLWFDSGNMRMFSNVCLLFRSPKRNHQIAACCWEDGKQKASDMSETGQIFVRATLLVRPRKRIVFGIASRLCTVKNLEQTNYWWGTLLASPVAIRSPNNLLSARGLREDLTNGM